MTADPFLHAFATASAAGGGDERLLQECMKEFYRSPRVSRILRFFAWRHKLDDGTAEDIRQNYAQRLYEQIGRKLSSADTLYDEISTDINHMMLNSRRKMRELSLEDISSRGGLESPEFADFLLDEAQRRGAVVGYGLGQEDALHRDYVARRCDAFTAKLSARGAAGVSNEVFTLTRLVRGKRDLANRPQAKKPSLALAARLDQKLRLKQIRDDLQLSMTSFAEALDVTPGRLTSILHSKGCKVPPSLLAEAERLVSEASKRGPLLSEVPMNEIVRGWLSRLGLGDAQGEEFVLADGALTKLARILGTNRSTTWRWYHNGRRPEPDELRQFDRVVGLVAKKVGAGGHKSH